MRKRKFWCWARAMVPAVCIGLVFLLGNPAAVYADSGVWQQHENDWYLINAEGTPLTGWQLIDERYYYFREDGSMQTSTLRKDQTKYSFYADGRFESARKERNMGGGSYPIPFFDADLQAMARTKGYGSGRIPDEGTIEDYLKSIRYNSGRHVMEVYLTNCDGVTHAGIAHEKVNGKDYFMIIFMR